MAGSGDRGGRALQALSEAFVTNVPKAAVEFPDELPISSRVRDIAKAIADHPVIIVAGENGVGQDDAAPEDMSRHGPWA